ncbi:hypothetical protein F4810DRAFT_671404 [Camillea tinctor]|nr:hypothetical protein F4810DRAFT_671404 [Camillea tinctor]
MRFTIFSILALGATLATAAPKVEARQEIGTFDTFTDDQCDVGGTGHDVNDDSFHDFEAGWGSVRSNLPDNCSLVIWWKETGTTQPPFTVISPPRVGECVSLEGNPSDEFIWNVSCN